jgi:3',5'-cyclic AMP phosphodiesterase CpdA
VQLSLAATLCDLAPSLVLLSGDITQRARSGQFRAAHEFVTGLHPIPCFAVPGNHDIPLFNLAGRLLHPYHGFQRYFQTRRETELRLGDVRVLAFNSTSRWRHVQGSVDVARVAPAVQAIGEEKFRIVMLHHPLECAKAVDDGNRVVNREALYGLFETARVDLILSGHVHDPHIAVSRGRVISVAGTCLSWRTRKGAPNSFNLLEIEDGTRLTITRYDYDGEQAFRPVEGWRRRFVRNASHTWETADPMSFGFQV